MMIAIKNHSQLGFTGSVCRHSRNDYVNRLRLAGLWKIVRGEGEDYEKCGWGVVETPNTAGINFFSESGPFCVESGPFCTLLMQNCFKLSTICYNMLTKARGEGQELAKRRGASGRPT